MWLHRVGVQGQQKLKNVSDLRTLKWLKQWKHAYKLNITWLKWSVNGVKRFIIKFQKFYNIFWGTNEGVARNLVAQRKIHLCDVKHIWDHMLYQVGISLCLQMTLVLSDINDILGVQSSVRILDLRTTHPFTSLHIPTHNYFTVTTAINLNTDHWGKGVWITSN